MKRMEQLWCALMLRPAWARLILGALVTVCLLGTFRLGIDHGLGVWFVDDDAAMVQHRRFQSLFGNDEVVLVTLEAPQGLTAERLQRLADITEAVGALPGVARVRSLSNLVTTEGPLYAPAFTPVVVDTVGQDDLARAHAAMARLDAAQRLAGNGGNVLAVAAWMQRGTQADQDRPHVLAGIREAVTSRAGNERVGYVGMGVLYDAINQATLGQGTVFTLLSTLMVVACLWWWTRRKGWTLLAVAVVLSADVVMLGVMGWAGRPVTMFTAALPSLVMVLGVANVLHIVQRLHVHGGTLTTPQLAHALAGVMGPCAFNAATEAAGFLCLLGTRTPITREFGLFGAVGVLSAAVLTWLWVAAVGPSLGAPQAHGGLAAAASNLAARCMARAAARPGRVLWASALVAAVSVWGASQLVVDTRAPDFLPTTHVFHEDVQHAQQHLGNFIPLEVLVEDAPDWTAEPFTTGLADAVADIESQWGPRSTFSVLDVLGHIRAVYSRRNVARPWRPETPEEVTFLTRLAGLAGVQQDLDLTVLPSQETLRLTVLLPVSSSLQYRDAAHQVVNTLARHLPPGTTITPAGYLPLNWRMAEQVVADQTGSFGLSLLVVFALVGLLVRSWRLTLAAVPSNVLPLGVVFALMAWWSIRLDIATVTVAATVLGVVVDDTVHVAWQFREQLERGASVINAAWRVGRDAGAALVGASGVLAAGFAVLALSPVRSVAYVGLLSGLAIVLALLGDLILLPALLAVLVRRRKSAQPEAQTGVVMEPATQ